jgi:hypothetical protein
MKIKAIIAGVALAVAGGTANATIEGGGAGSGELFLNIWDMTGAESYTRDLGITIADAGSTLTFTADATLTSWMAGRTGLIWSIGGQVNNVDPTNNLTFVSTANATPTPVKGNFDSANTATTSLLTGVNMLGDHGSVANGSSTAGVGDASAYIVNSTGTTFGTLVANSFSDLGIGMDIFSMERLATVLAPGFPPSEVTPINIADIGDAVLLGDGTLQLNAVPEPSTYALMGIGLLSLLGLGRRRTQKIG